MRIIKWEDAEISPNPHKVDARKIYDTKNAQVVVITLEPGERLKRHITSVDVVFYILEGEGRVEIGDEKQEVGSDTLIDSPAKIPHCWYNDSDKRLRFLVMKVPRPTESTKLL